MAQNPLLASAQDRELWGLTRAVLDYMCGQLDFENYVFIAQKDIADHLGVRQPKISMALKKLVNRQIIIEQKIGRTNFYRLNPAYGWKGDNKKAHEYQLELIRGGKD